MKREQKEKKGWINITEETCTHAPKDKHCIQTFISNMFYCSSYKNGELGLRCTASNCKWWNIRVMVSYSIYGSGASARKGAERHRREPGLIPAELQEDTLNLLHQRLHRR